jgi:hypothetical protein
VGYKHEEEASLRIIIAIPTKQEKKPKEEKLEKNLVKWI